MPRILTPLAFTSLMFSGAIFGFFYAWVCSTMWGLDSLDDPRIAIAAMNAMNESVRNPVFAPAFFGTPVVLIVTGAVAWTAGLRRAATAFLAAGALYIVGAFAVTASVNVPMNRAMIDAGVPGDIDTARAVWTAYSAKWQSYNILRTLVSGAVLALTGWGLFATARR